MGSKISSSLYVVSKSLEVVVTLSESSLNAEKLAKTMKNIINKDFIFIIKNNDLM
jgi:hypothetical protein